MSASVPQLRTIARSNDMDHGQLNGIANFIWMLSNRKPAHRKGKVQLIDATKWFKSLRKNLMREAS
jgi:type I restriction-modification system DNA methylase subunit